MADKFPGPDDPLTALERSIWGHDARRHSVVTTMIVEQSVGSHDPDAQAIAFVENLAKSDPDLAAMWRRKLAMAKK